MQRQYMVYFFTLLITLSQALSAELRGPNKRIDNNILTLQGDSQTTVEFLENTPIYVKVLKLSKPVKSSYSIEIKFPARNGGGSLPIVDVYLNSILILVKNGRKMQIHYNEIKSNPFFVIDCDDMDNRMIVIINGGESKLEMSYSVLTIDQNNHREKIIVTPTDENPRPRPNPFTPSNPSSQETCQRGGVVSLDSNIITLNKNSKSTIFNFQNNII